MTTLHEMLHKITCTPEYDKMLRSVAPFCECFRVNHFYYGRNLSKEGLLTTIGTHSSWYEYHFDNPTTLQAFPCNRDPKILSSGVNLIKSTHNPYTIQVLDTVWEKFNINFTININKIIPGGIESFGFGVNVRDPKIDEWFINELPLIYRFIDFFCKENQKLLHIAYDNQVEIAPIIGPLFYQAPESYLPSIKKRLLLRQLGLNDVLSLTPREIEILKYLALGFSANYIGKELYLSTRTIENHIANIKSKLGCNSKTALIKKAHEAASIMHG